MPHSRTTEKSSYLTDALNNGLHAVYKVMPQAQSVAIGIWVRAGGRYESPELAGISHLLEHTLVKGTRRRSCEQLKQAIEGIGGSLNGFTAEEFTCYTAKVPKRSARSALRVLADMVRFPRLTAEDLLKEREVVLEEIRMYEDSPGQYIHDVFNELLWPNHPLGMLLSGTVDTVRRISRDDVVRYWRQMYQPRNVLLACAGAVEPATLTRDVRTLFGTMRPATPSRFARAPRPRRGPQVRIWSRPTEQTHVCLGTYAVPRTHPDRFALELLHVLLGANMSSRLFREVREKRGLVYEIGTHIKRFADTGAFVISAGCETTKLADTVRTIMGELSKIRRGDIARSELKRAKDYYAGQLLMGLEDTMDHMLWIGEQAATVGRIATPERLEAYVAKVTARDVQRVARHLFVTPRLHLAVVGPVAGPEADRLRTLCRIA